MGIGRFIRKAPKRVLIVARRPAALFDSVALSQLSTLEPLLNGSRVAVIGNAQSIFHRRDGREIDDYDVIVRMNHGVVTSPQHQGSRTDVLCVASAMTITELRSRFGSPVVVHTSAHRTRMKLSVVYGYPKLFFTPRKLWRDLREQLHHPPSTGLMTLEFLSRYFAPQQISLFGFDWMKTKTSYHDELLIKWHNWEAEEQHVQNWAQVSPGRRLLPPVAVASLREE